MSGKGSSRRPTTLTAAELAERWAQTFGASHDQPVSASMRPDVHRIDERLWHVNHEGME